MNLKGCCRVVNYLRYNLRPAIIPKERIEEAYTSGLANRRRYFKKRCVCKKGRV